MSKIKGNQRDELMNLSRIENEMNRIMFTKTNRTTFKEKKTNN